MTIKIALFPDENYVNWRMDSSRLDIGTFGAETMPVGVRKFTSPEMEGVDCEIETFKNETGEVRDLNGIVIKSLTTEGDIFFLSDKRMPSLERRNYGVVFYQKGKNPER